MIPYRQEIQFIYQISNKVFDLDKEFTSEAFSYMRVVYENGKKNEVYEFGTQKWSLIISKNEVTFHILNNSFDINPKNMKNHVRLIYNYLGIIKENSLFIADKLPGMSYMITLANEDFKYYEQMYNRFLSMIIFSFYWLEHLGYFD